jgi:2,3-bisphosphoglycerate-dependent phosphoglycerate mutase
MQKSDTRKKMDTTIIAVRHGETEWNKAGKQQGHLNSNLTELGIRQAQAIADGMQKLSIDKFYCSDLGRAVQTAKIISQNIGKEFIPDTKLREQNLGILQGLTRNDFKLQFPKEYSQFISNNPDYRIPEGESIRERFSRCINYIEEISKIHRGKSILIVTHGGALTSFIQKALSIPLTQKRTFSLLNGSINIFSISETMEWRLEVWGDINHMHAHNLDTFDDN